MRVEFSLSTAEVQRALEARAKRMTENLESVVGGGAELLAGRWRENAPRGPDPTRPRGRPHYQDAIHVDPEESRPTFVSFLVGAGIYGIPWWQEYGTVNHPPQPSARPSFDETREAIVEIVKQGVIG